MSYGMLGADPSIRGSWPPGVAAGLDPDLPTRWEEFRFVYDRIPSGSEVLDIGTGYIRGWHVLPELLATKGCRITAIDSNPRTLEMPEHGRIERCHEDLFALDPAERSAPIVTCISVIEHMTERDEALSALCALTEDLLIVTADKQDPEHLAQIVFENGLEPGERTTNPVSSLDPEVAYLTARRSG